MSLIQILLRAAGFGRPIHNPRWDAGASNGDASTNWAGIPAHGYTVKNVGHEKIDGIEGTVYEIKFDRDGQKP